MSKTASDSTPGDHKHQDCAALNQKAINAYRTLLAQAAYYTPFTWITSLLTHLTAHLYWVFFIYLYFIPCSPGYSPIAIYSYYFSHTISELQHEKNPFRCSAKLDTVVKHTNKKYNLVKLMVHLFARYVSHNYLHRPRPFIKKKKIILPVRFEF